LWTAKSIELRNGSHLSFADVGPARKTGPRAGQNGDECIIIGLKPKQGSP
jgi:hypothetical protein